MPLVYNRHVSLWYTAGIHTMHGVWLGLATRAAGHHKVKWSCGSNIFGHRGYSTKPSHQFFALQTPTSRTEFWRLKQSHSQLQSCGSTPAGTFFKFQDGAVPRRVIGYGWLQLCHLSMGTGTGTIRSTTSLVPAQYFSAKKAATPARIQTWSQARHGEAVLIQCGFLPSLWTAYSCFFSHVAVFFARSFI